jgi:hypothetical protein
MLRKCEINFGMMVKDQKQSEEGPRSMESELSFENDT